MKCVYMHLKDGVVRYIGSGNSERPHVTHKHRRGKLWNEMFRDEKPEVVIVKENLTKEEAIELESQLIVLHSATVINTADPLKTTKDIPLYEMKEYFAISPESPSGLVLIKRTGNRTAGVGKPAGSILKKENGKEYWQVQFRGKVYKVHRIMYALSTGKVNFGIINHKDNNGLNNSVDNLEESCEKRNAHNTSLSCKNTTGFQNIYDNGKSYRFNKMIGGKVLHKSIGYGNERSKQEALDLILEYKRKILENELTDYLSSCQ